MAEPVTAQARLDRIVVLIASNMVAEVCSLYVVARRRTVGAVRHRGPQARGRASDDHAPGRGAGRPDRRHAPNRSPCRTRRAIRRSPTSPKRARKSISRSSACRCCAAAMTLGVLVVQNRARRSYSEEEIEALQTTAMLLAEMIASGELQAIVGPGGGDRAAPAAFVEGIADRRRAGPRPCRLAPAAHRRDQDRRRRRRQSSSARLDDGDRGDARFGRRTHRSLATTASAASIARCSRRSG